jgi:hypothetical protein
MAAISPDVMFHASQVAGPWTLAETRFNSAVLSEDNRAALVT